MKNIRLIAADLDGTLLSSEKTLSEENRAALYEAASLGIEFVPSTGRFYDALPQCIRELPFIHYAITINGAQVFDVRNRKNLYSATVDLETALSIYRFLEDYPVIYDCYQNDAAWISRSMMDVVEDYFIDPFSCGLIKTSRTVVPDLKKFLTDRNAPLQKVQFFTRDNDLKAELIGKVKDLYPSLSVVTSTPTNVEITSGLATKGLALKSLSEYLGIDTASVMCFGDDTNDVSLLETAGIGIAMANAKPGLKEKAAFITLSNDENGVAYGIRKFIHEEA